MRRILGRAAALALIAGLCAAIPTAGAAPRVHAASALTLPAHPDGLSRALAAGRISPAKEALLRAQALFHPARVAAVYGPVAHSGGDATIILRDLALRLDGLTATERGTADGTKETHDRPPAMPRSRGRWCRPVSCSWSGAGSGSSGGGSAAARRPTDRSPGCGARAGGRGTGRSAGCGPVCPFAGAGATGGSEPGGVPTAGSGLPCPVTAGGRVCPFAPTGRSPGCGPVCWPTPAGG